MTLPFKVAMPGNAAAPGRSLLEYCARNELLVKGVCAGTVRRAHMALIAVVDMLDEAAWLCWGCDGA